MNRIIIGTGAAAASRASRLTNAMMPITTTPNAPTEGAKTVAVIVPPLIIDTAGATAASASPITHHSPSQARPGQRPMADLSASCPWITAPAAIKATAG